MSTGKNAQKKLLKMQKEEITGHVIYSKLANIVKDKKNKEILNKISSMELSHYNLWKTITLKDVKPNLFKIIFCYLIARFLGLNFGVRLVERLEDYNLSVLKEVRDIDPRVENLIKEEELFEESLFNLIDEEKLRYTSSIILGLSDALIELTGVLAGLTFAINNTRIIAGVGLITGIAASMSMTASQYLSVQEEEERSSIKSGIFTGLTYTLTVFFLIFPYFILTNPYVCLFTMIGFAIVLIVAFAFYTSIARNLSFKKRFLEMLFISLSVAVLNFMIGMFVKKYLGINI